ncbi:FAR-17a/AIG1-like protein-domain-containing protein [Mycotypha africana]|uniref:FAR-17a/AIG1-like protein-domain-containing protein n=1 Tax=Mycotypha africana TaxID=64632 RepID=UPI00230072AA|nr:FAR-17a/AIG1-like protein-domain-containing protein [Mycotypha africana]KAI8984680.1 FAR-17a/AIG1-like protein-domain-containing protein [Mycotypha africana]
MTKGLNLIVITFGLLTSFYGFYGIGFGVPAPGYGGHFQYLTIMGLLVATLMFMVRIIHLLSGTMKVVYETLTAIATPIEGLVSVLYWPLVLYDKSLLIPEDTVFDLPLKLDVCLHLFPTVVCWIDFMVFNTSYKRSPLHILAIYAFTMFYYVWLNICFEHNGFWPYPMLGLFKSDFQRGAFFLLCGWLCSNLYKIIAKGHALLHPKDEVLVEKDPVKKLS